MGVRNNKAGLVALSLLSMVVNQTVHASHAIYPEDTTSEQLPEITVVGELGSSGRIPPIVKKFKLPQTTESTTAEKIANNNTIGAPRWRMVAPEEIQRIDMMYGQYAAAYPENSMGAVMQITTRMPDKFEDSISQTSTVL